MRDIIKDSVNQSTEVRFVDADGPVTNVNAATPGLAILYRRLGGIATSIGTINDLGSQDAAHNDAGLIHVGAGYYRVDLPDAAVATGADAVSILPSATNMTGIGVSHALVEAVSAGAGTGARTVTITIEDEDGDPLEGARVRLTKAAETYIVATNASGEAVFNVDDGTWTVSVSLPGYTFDGDALVVDGTEDVTYEMIAVTITPSDPGYTTGYFTAYDENNEPEADVVITCTLRAVPKNSTGLALDTNPRAATSDVNGLVSFTNLVKGATYEFYRGATGTKLFSVEISTAAGSTTALKSIMGSD